MLKKYFLVPAVVASLVLYGFGCASKTTQVEDDASSTDKVTYKTDTGETETIEMRGRDGQLPDDFPKDFPIMSDLKVLNFTSVSQDGDSIIGGQWTSNASVGDIFAFYKNALTQGNWKITNTTTYGNSSLIGFARKGDERFGGSMNMEQQSDGSTTVSFTYTFIKDVDELKKAIGL